jgi:hypothetical protein
MHLIESGLNKINGEFTRRMSVESENDSRLEQFAKKRALQGGFGAQWNYHNSVFLKRQVLSRLIYQDFLYKKILSVPGVICEFGVHWGATMAVQETLGLNNLRLQRFPHQPYCAFAEFGA